MKDSRGGLKTLTIDVCKANLIPLGSAGLDWMGIVQWNPYPTVATVCSRTRRYKHQRYPLSRRLLDGFSPQLLPPINVDCQITIFIYPDIVVNTIAWLYSVSKYSHKSQVDGINDSRRLRDIFHLTQLLIAEAILVELRLTINVCKHRPVTCFIACGNLRTTLRLIPE